MSDPRERLKKHLKKMVKEILAEISTSDGAGAFLTKGAFRGNGEGARARQRKNAEQLGYKLTDRGRQEADRAADNLKA